MSSVRSATSILTEIRDGHAVVELGDEIHRAIAAVKEHGKPAKVTLELTISPLRNGAEKLIEAPLAFTAEISSKLPQPDPEKTLFFVDAEGNATRNPSERQQDLGLRVAGSESKKTA
jgi:hypothetical protein